METSYVFLNKLEGKLAYSKENSVNIWNYYSKIRAKEHFLILEVKNNNNFIRVKILTKNGISLIEMFTESLWNERCEVKNEIDVVE
jgi:hypothetical protein